MNPLLERLHPYPFERLADLLADVQPPAGLRRIPLSIGEPRHETPRFILDALTAGLAEGAGVYPVSLGLDTLRGACADWLGRRFGVQVDPVRSILPVNGTREGLFSFAQAVIDARARSIVAMPNPFYQIYEGAALLAGAEPWYLPTLADYGFRPRLADVPVEVWSGTALVFVCSPGNPTGAVLDGEFYRELLTLADRHDFVIAADECYADIYLDEPPVSLLEVCRDTGRDDYDRCVVFHSLSKRSNIPGLRSGFVAGDARLMEGYRRYRTYHGCAMPVPTQLASVAAWRDDEHVETNRRLYARKFREVTPILREVMDVEAPPASFYLWAGIEGDDEAYARDLYGATNVVTLPGSYLGRVVDGRNPGSGRLRLSLVAEPDECVEAAQRIRDFARNRGSGRKGRQENP
ncbi:MAG: succinyldiaminopimelate transaminase [Gammaproteobacteria bacterium]